VRTIRQLELIASNLDDMSVTLEEIKEHVQQGNPLAAGVLDSLRGDMQRVSERIDEWLACHAREGPLL
jgi:hypothetical protein